MQVHLTRVSDNPKTGPMPVSTTEQSSCPNTCPLKVSLQNASKPGSCYASYGPLKWHWQRVSDGRRGTSFTTFLQNVRRFPSGTVWRHNQAGDLPGANNRIHLGQMAALVDASRGTRGFTFTHKPVTPSRHVTPRMASDNRRAISRANASGFTVNLSADTLQYADDLVDLDIGPVVVVLDSEHGVRHDGITTPAGRKVVTCPATYRNDVTCLSCQLCQRQSRKVIVGFPAHGSGKVEAAGIASGVLPVVP